ncbi:MAG TPA: c-type cytochrome [Blastocatellia bacterium]|nr:c-type cytochrome [Blastocatellia bacterium]
MKLNILGAVALGLLLSTPFVILTGRSDAQGPRDESNSTTATQASLPEKTLGQVGQNIQALNGVPESQLYPVMRFMGASLGVQCGFCHVFTNSGLDAASDDKQEKRTARDMIRMVAKINEQFGPGEPRVSCFTCHGGQTSPQAFPNLPLPLPAPRAQAPPAPSVVSPTSPNMKPDLPPGDEILNKYFNAIGGLDAIDRIKSCLIKGTRATLAGGPLAYEASQSLPGKGYESFLTLDGPAERLINGQRGWTKDSDGVKELLGPQLLDQKLSLPFFMILRLKDQYSSVRASSRARIDDRDVYVVSAVRHDNKRERLYFETKSGLLRRRISYTDAIVGVIPEQTDFEDYREVEGLKLPFAIRTLFVDARIPIVTRQFTEIKLNAPLGQFTFDKPMPKNPTMP